MALMGDVELARELRRVKLHAEAKRERFGTAADWDRELPPAVWSPEQVAKHRLEAR